MSDNLTLLAVFLGSSVVLTGLSIPLMLKLVAPNPVYGWRTASTRNNPDIWYPVNQMTGVWLFVTGEMVAAVAVWTHLAQLAADTAAWITLAALAAGFVAVIIHGNLLIQRIQRDSSMSVHSK